MILFLKMSKKRFSNYFETSLDKFNKKESVIGILGLGYVGLPLALNYAENDYKLIGIDINEQKINSLNKSKSYISYISDQRILDAKNNCLFTSDFSAIKKVDAIIICVPTPLSKHREPDLSFVLKTLENALPYLKKGQIISLESTTFPGTTEEIIKPIIESRNFVIGKDLFLVYSPERDDPGNKTFNTKNTPKILGGSTVQCKEIGSLYKHIR